MENTLARKDALAALRARLATLEPPARAPGRGVRAGAGFEAIWETRGLHELYARTAPDTTAANALGLILSLRAAGHRAIVWVFHDGLGREAGQPYGQGVLELGVPPDQLLLVRTRDAAALLAVGEEAARSPAVGAVLLSAWGESRAFSLTASRRLGLAAAEGGGSLFLARAGAAASPSAARSRCAVQAHPSTPLEGEAPGHPSFSVTLLRHRGGDAPGHWIMEWDRERRAFVEPAPLSGAVVPLVAQRAAETDPGRRHVA